MKPFNFVAMGLLLTFLGACGSGPSSDGTTNASASTENQNGQVAVQNLMELCSGNYVCQGPEVEEFRDPLTKIEGACYLDEILLNPDGTGKDIDGFYSLANGFYNVSVKWEGDASSFQICEYYEPACVPDSEICDKGTPVDGPACYRCNLNEQAAGVNENEEAASCTGLASSCSGRSAGNCSTQIGCYLGTHFLPAGGSELQCKGTPHSCSSFHSESSCIDQDDCNWE